MMRPLPPKLVYCRNDRLNFMIIQERVAWETDAFGSMHFRLSKPFRIPGKIVCRRLMMDWNGVVDERLNVIIP